MLWLAPTMRNSNLLPVKAKGEVRLRSESSSFKSGRLFTPVRSAPRSSFCSAWPSASSCSICVSALPRKILTTAGGASLPPRRSSLPGQLAERRSRSAYLSTAVSTAHSVTRKTGFSSGLSVGFRRFLPVLVTMLQLLCLPLPFAAGTQNCGAELPCASAPS